MEEYLNYVLGKIIDSAYPLYTLNMSFESNRLVINPDIIEANLIPDMLKRDLPNWKIYYSELFEHYYIYNYHLENDAKQYIRSKGLKELL